jgi:hypothetical protein
MYKKKQIQCCIRIKKKKKFNSKLLNNTNYLRKPNFNSVHQLVGYLDYYLNSIFELKFCLSKYLVLNINLEPNF